MTYLWAFFFAQFIHLDDYFEVYTCCLAHALNRNKAMEGKLPVSAVYVTEKVRLEANLDGSIRPHVI